MWDSGGAGMLLFGMKIRNEDGNGSEGKPRAHSQCLVLVTALSENQDAYICSVVQRGPTGELTVNWFPTRGRSLLLNSQNLSFPLDSTTWTLPLTVISDIDITKSLLWGGVITEGAEEDTLCCTQ